MRYLTMDGANAAAWASYPFIETAAVYPITPSTVMSETVDLWAAQGKTNLFGESVTVSVMQSEAGAAGAVHGALTCGALAATYTASQGLLLMIPNMYKMAGELLPCVIHVAARTVSSHALSIFGDHSDIYACRQTGFAMLCSADPQEVMDLGAAAHLCAISGRVPFLHFFDGFRTSHEIRKIRVWENSALSELLDRRAVQEFRHRALNPEQPGVRGTSQTPDIFFQMREASNKYYDKLPEIVENYMNKINSLIGTDYRLFNYYGSPEAEHIIIAMGSVTGTIEETTDILCAQGEAVGMVKVRLYRPFAAEKLLEVIPDTVKIISVLDRTKECGSVGEPLFLDVCAALNGSRFKDVKIFGGRYGISSKDATPEQIVAVFRNKTKSRFTIGITDDVTGLSLDPLPRIVKSGFDASTDTPERGISGCRWDSKGVTTPLAEGVQRGTESHPESVECKFWGLGSDGTVGANKNSIKIIGGSTSMHVQAYFSYDSKKSGGVTVSHLRFSQKPIKAACEIYSPDFAACHNSSYIKKYRIAEEIKPGGTFLLNTGWRDKELDKNLPESVKRYIAVNKIRFYTVDADGIAEKIGLGGRINTILQAAFFRLTNIIPADEAISKMKSSVKESYEKKGQDVVERNFRAIDCGWESVTKVDVPAEWAEIPDATHEYQTGSSFKDRIQIPCAQMQGNELPVSVFSDMADGTFPCGTTRFEKRGFTRKAPKWLPENCIQCCQCSLVCPHSVIRTFAVTAEQAEKAPDGLALIDMKPAFEGMKFAVKVSVLDCTGCGSCVSVCPARNKAIVMENADELIRYQQEFEWCVSLPDNKAAQVRYPMNTIKGSQLRQPLLEFSGACAGCGETPYAKLVTQLFGRRMIIANATGCSSIWGASAPSMPYCTGKDGRGPAWANSLFEDNAEFGFGMTIAAEKLRQSAAAKVKELLNTAKSPAVRRAAEEYLDTFGDGAKNTDACDSLISELKTAGEGAEVLEMKEFLGKRSIWLFGGDGWAYDIGFGGLDHVLASGKNLNILVFDTEIYSNTGGQASKSTPAGAVARLAPKGKTTRKKDLAAIAISTGNVYTASVSMGADMNQCIKAICEAESFPGVSLIIAYAPCIGHGIRGGLTLAQAEEKLAVKSGYWHLFRYDPSKDQPMQIDSKAPDSTAYREFLNNELRFSSLAEQNPESAERLFEDSYSHAEKRYEFLQFIKK